jgi:hypothetical protein
MKLKSSLLISTVAACAAGAALIVFAHQSGKPAPPLPDAPQATTAATTVPNGPFLW